jgi:hypothetical protein
MLNETVSTIRNGRKKFDRCQRTVYLEPWWNIDPRGLERPKEDWNTTSVPNFRMGNITSKLWERSVFWVDKIKYCSRGLLEMKALRERTYVVYSESSWTRFIKSVFYLLSGTSFLSPSDAMHLYHLRFHWLKYPWKSSSFKPLSKVDLGKSTIHHLWWSSPRMHPFPLRLSSQCNIVFFATFAQEWAVLAPSWHRSFSFLNPLSNWVNECFSNLKFICYPLKSHPAVTEDERMCSIDVFIAVRSGRVP